MMRFVYEPKIRGLREDVLHRYANFSACLSAQVELLRRVEEANANYSRTEREYLEAYLSTVRSPSYHSIGINNIPQPVAPSYNLSDRIRAVVDEMNKAATAVAKSRTDYSNAARVYNDELNGHAFRVYRFFRGKAFGKAIYDPKDRDVIAQEFKVFDE